MSMGPIGVFDSGYGGLTVLRELVVKLPQYDFLYLGDNARTPYGTRSFQSVYEFTLQGVQYLFDQGCHLVILACNTASAKALRTIQQNDLHRIGPGRKVLGVLRPTTEEAGRLTRSGSIGIFATAGTVLSDSYKIEINKFFPNVSVYQEACPMWVPLVENEQLDNEGSHYFVKENVDNLFAQCGSIDTVLLACTHYPLLIPVIRRFIPAHTHLVSQGSLVAEKLADYLHRHQEIDLHCQKQGKRTFLTTDDAAKFSELATLFFGDKVAARQVHL